MKIEIKQQPRVYNFSVNGVSFSFTIDGKKEDSIMTPKEILIKDLESCLEELKKQVE